MKKFLAILLAALMILGGTAMAESDNLTYILGWGIGGDTQGPVTGWVGDVWAKKGLQLEAIGNGNSEEKMQAMLASGDIPDIIRFNTWNQFEIALEADYLLCLDDYIDQLPMTQKYASNALQFVRDLHSNGTGKLYGIPDNVGKSTSLTGNTPGCYAINVRWDIYREAGYPEAETLEDTIEVLKKMKEVYPKTADGLETYAMNMFAAWDGTSRFSFANAVLTTLGYYEGGQNYFVNHDMKTDTVTSMFDDDGAFHRACHYLFLLNQAGLVDPDALTQEYTTSQSKLNDTKQYFAAWWGGYPATNKDEANAEEPIGWAPLIFGEYTASLQGDFPCGSGWPLCISAKAAEKGEDYLKACLTYVDANADPEFLYELLNGPRGVFWDVDADGKTYALDAAYTRADTGTYTLESGEEYKYWNGRYTLNSTAVNTAFDNTFNDTLNVYSNDNNLYKQWAEHYGGGFEFPMDYLKAENRVAINPTFYQFMPVLPDDMQIIKDAAGAVVQQSGWKMVYAADEAEFEAIWQQMKADALALGAEDLQNWYAETAKAAREAAAPYEYKD